MSWHSLLLCSVHDIIIVMRPHLLTWHRYAAFYAQQQASAVDPYAAAAQAAYLQQPGLGGVGGGAFPGGFVGVNSPAGFALNGAGAGFNMASLQLEQQMQLMQQQQQQPQHQQQHGQGAGVLSGHDAAGGGSTGGGGGGPSAGAESGNFDQLASLGSFNSMPMIGSQMMSG